MKHLSIRNSVLIGTATGVVALGAIVAACGGSSSNGNGGNDNGSSSGTSSGTSSGSSSGSTGVSTTVGSCANSVVPISFSPMYSAYIPGSTAQQFQIPAITGDGNSAIWSSSDLSTVSMTVDPTSGGVMITVSGTGTVTIFATESDGSCGASTLNITTNAENDWQTGNARYNNGVALHVPTGPGGGGGLDGGGFTIPDGGFPEGGAFHRPDGGGFFQQDGGSFLEADGGVACTNCHGSNSTSTLFTDVSHTPEQTGGFSDQDLINIIVNGEIPDGGYFDPTVIDKTCVDGGAQCTARAYQTWHGIHQWNDITSDEYAGIVCYLRSLTPAPQDGTSNFGGGTHPHHDGGAGGGGGGGGGSSSGTTSSSSGGTTTDDAGATDQ